MNHVEGGVEDLFRFSSAQEFIDFLLDLTVAPDSVTGIATRLGQVSKQLAAKPAKQDEQGFNRRRRSVQLGHLPDLTTPPAEHRDIVGGIRDGLADRLAQIAEQKEERRTQRESLQEQEKQLITDRNAADQKLSAATSSRQSLGERLDALCDSPRVRELAEASEGESVILWSESPVLLRRLSDAILAADDERIRRRAERHVDERTITEHDRSQFLPSSLDADQVRDALMAVSAAQTGWTHLRDTVAPRDLLALLDTPAIARLGSGVVVPPQRPMTRSPASKAPASGRPASSASTRQRPPGLVPRRSTRLPGQRFAVGW